MGRCTKLSAPKSRPAEKEPTVKGARAHQIIYAFAAILFSLPLAAGAQEGAKKIVRSQDDMPRYTYEIDLIPSEMFMSREAFLPFAERVAADVQEVLATHEIEDKTTLKGLYNTLENLALLQGSYDQAVVYARKIRELEEKAAAKLLSGLVVRSIAYAAKAAPEGDPARNAAFRTTFSNHIRGLPWDVVQDNVEQMKGSLEIISENLYLGIIQNQMDPAVEKTGNVSNDLADGLIGMRATVDAVLPYREQVISVLQAYIDENRTEKPNIWADRSVDLNGRAGSEPVLVAIWDTGVDPGVFGDLMYRNEYEELDGVDNDDNGFVDDIYGLAFEWSGGVTAGALHPLAETARDRLPGMTDQMKGLNDIQAGVDSPEAQALKQHLSTMQPDEVKPFLEELGLFAIYAHGTHVAGIAVEANPAARVLVVRQEFPYEMIPPPMLKEDAERWVANLPRIVDYLRQNGVRVVNMSWGFSPPDFESMFEVNAIGSSAEERKEMAREIFDMLTVAMRNAFQSAPEILFIPAAGNSNNDATFDEFIPSSLELPNVITAAAVDQAGEETSFTSYGPSVDVHSNGFEVESYIPGGERLPFSGTSMAAPNVANLAAKLIALDPALTPPEVIALIEAGAEASEDGRLRLIHPERSLELLMERQTTGSE
jgi:subtilisin family serine protease